MASVSNARVTDRAHILYHMTDVTEPHDGPQEAQVLPAYTPFPSFTQWLVSELDLSSFDQYRELLLQAKSTAPEEDLASAVDIASRTAAVDTGAIEGLYTVDRGFTATIAGKAANWEQVIAAKGEMTKRSIEDAFAAYNLILDAVTESHGPITEVWIKQLHATICAHQDTYRVFTDLGPQDQALPKGEYKKTRTLQ